MRLLILTPKTDNVEPILAVLRREHYTNTVEYDREPWAEARRRSRDADGVIYLGAIPTHHGRFVPDAEQLRDLPAPAVHICFDAVEPDWQPFLREYDEKGAFRLQVAIDGVKNKYCGMFALPPVDIGWQRTSWAERVAKIGMSCNSFLPARNELLSSLEAAGMLDRRERGGKYGDFQSFQLQHRFALNLPTSGSGRARHVKARTVEAGAAGCLLIEERGSPLANWFEAGADYLEFSNLGDVVAHIDWARREPVSAENMAREFQRKVLAKCNPLVFWDKVLGFLL